MMEGGVRRGGWNRKAPLSTVLLLMCALIPTATLVQPPEKRTCPGGEYRTEDGICCNKCHRGFKLVEMCHDATHRSKCTVCPPGQYNNLENYARTCRSCKTCKPLKHEVLVTPCTIYEDTTCRCKDGFFKVNIDSVTSECLMCRVCGSDEKEKQTCTPERNTVCECPEKHHRVNRKCEPCKNCTADCQHLCVSPPAWNTKVPPPGTKQLINIIGGVAAVAVVLLVVVVVVTYMVTKWSTKRRLLKVSSPSPDSTESCEQVLIHSEDPSHHNKAAPPSPASEHGQPSNLPDCVPLEIKIPDLVYTVLDLVPVLQVKQLVRLLGVRDTAIEQAELDHRSCREAHYQMLRVWAERGSRAGGVLHRPLLQDLLDGLRKMHLGRAAEELETKFAIQ